MKAFLRTHHYFCCAIGIAAAVNLFCGVFGWKLCAVQSGSMEPAIPIYSICLVKTHADYDGLKVGDVVVYTRPTDGKRIIHRVTALTADGAVVKGDANQFNDDIKVTSENLYARYIGHVPYAAYLYNLFHSWYGVCITAGLAILLFAVESWDAVRQSLRRETWDNDNAPGVAQES